jgi:hypothetical protein
VTEMRRACSKRGSGIMHLRRVTVHQPPRHYAPSCFSLSLSLPALVNRKKVPRHTSGAELRRELNREGLAPLAISARKCLPGIQPLPLFELGGNNQVPFCSACVE